MIKKIDGVLELLKNIFLTRPVSRHIGDRPQNALDADLRQGAHANAIPAHCPIPRQGGRQANIFCMHHARARCLSKTINCLRHLGRTRKKTINTLHAGKIIRIAKIEIGAIGVLNIGLRIRDEQAFL